ncbi:TetR/AcrR family transcriptional regulator [Oenococcus oeni]|uniref:TetR family transcriptional regulator n=21 Tax=Oenococcus oeni TaxID=1247 RepID=A0A483BDK8_OENOE|nr:TetR/AcrR family transcriptional regulator [Oenococcus oeni]KGO16759.1 transcriptional regulator [Oenococcus oeni X2L]AWW98927.1 TetR/AcrR family transcriptional regulator [Oenococcus oeni]EJO00252.1 transcriptional regulator [Oenococcus oeni AWRIB419]EJO03200.1 transcriptional regulator [Oenococcus oeni AWRIB418]EJO05115.1 transcriptional regulator [Oenococcus oeni AWRIB548]
MPKETFYNLSEEKRQRIINSAEKEFFRVPLSKASIANIVTGAQIPRGSFYQYFDDLNDLYHYFFEKKFQGFHENFKKELENHQGDLIEAWRQVAKKVLRRIVNGENSIFFENAIFGLNIQRDQNIIDSFANFHHPENKAPEYFDEIDFSFLKIKSKKDLITLRHIMSGIIIQAATAYFSKCDSGQKVDLEEILEGIDKQIDWLKYGVYKEKEHD